MPPRWRRCWWGTRTGCTRCRGIRACPHPAAAAPPRSPPACCLPPWTAPWCCGGQTRLRVTRAAGRQGQQLCWLAAACCLLLSCAGRRCQPFALHRSTAACPRAVRSSVLATKVKHAVKVSATATRLVPSLPVCGTAAPLGLRLSAAAPTSLLQAHLSPLAGCCCCSFGSLHCSVERIAATYVSVPCRHLTGLWMSEESVGDAGANHLGYYTGVFAPLGDGIAAHGFTGALHVWRRGGDGGWAPRSALGGHFAPGGHAPQLDAQPCSSLPRPLPSRLLRPACHGYPDPRSCLMWRQAIATAAIACPPPPAAAAPLLQWWTPAGRQTAAACSP
jgi:hypothetical protein